jgi:hypothetical protein
MECFVFDRFRYKTIPELAGLRSAGFWRNVVLPACYSEPAILRASIALACASKSWAEKTSANSNISRQNKGLIADEEYNKSIRSLNEHIQKHREARSLRVVLITCVMFISLELFSNRIGKAVMHLEMGESCYFSCTILRTNTPPPLGPKTRPGHCTSPQNLSLWKTTSSTSSLTLTSRRHTSESKGLC